MKPSKETTGKKSCLRKVMKVTHFRGIKVIILKLKWDINFHENFLLEYIIDYHKANIIILEL